MWAVTEISWLAGTVAELDFAATLRYCVFDVYLHEGLGGSKNFSQ